MKSNRQATDRKGGKRMTQEQVLAKLTDCEQFPQDDGKVYVEGYIHEDTIFVEGYVGADGNVSELLFDGCPVEGLAVSV